MPLSAFLTAIGMTARLGIVLVRVKRGFAGQELDDSPGSGCGRITSLIGQAMVHGYRPLAAKRG